MGYVLAVLTLAVSTFVIGSPGVATASRLHTYHASLTRIDYNAKEKAAEVSIQLFTHDLVPVLEKFSGRRVDLEKTPDIDKTILSYLSSTFVFRDGRGRRQDLMWVGKEVDVDSVYVFVQVPLPDGLESTSLQNSIFLETFPKQANLVIARLEKRKCDLVFVRGDTYKVLSFSEAAK